MLTVPLLPVESQKLLFQRVNHESTFVSSFLVFHQRQLKLISTFVILSQWVINSSITSAFLSLDSFCVFLNLVPPCVLIIACILVMQASSPLGYLLLLVHSHSLLVPWLLFRGSPERSYQTVFGPNSFSSAIISACTKMCFRWVYSDCLDWIRSCEQIILCHSVDSQSLDINWN